MLKYSFNIKNQSKLLCEELVLFPHVIQVGEWEFKPLDRTNALLGLIRLVINIDFNKLNPFELIKSDRALYF